MTLADGARIHYIEGGGRRDAPPLLFIPGWTFELADQPAGAKQMPDARAIVIPDAGHAVFHDQPEAFEHALRDFLAGLPG